MYPPWTLFQKRTIRTELVSVSRWQSMVALKKSCYVIRFLFAIGYFTKYLWTEQEASSGRDYLVIYDSEFQCFQLYDRIIRKWYMCDLKYFSNCSSWSISEGIIGGTLPAIILVEWKRRELNRKYWCILHVVRVLCVCICGYYGKFIS